jgi:hypothetical protein
MLVICYRVMMQSQLNYGAFILWHLLMGTPESTSTERNRFAGIDVKDVRIPGRRAS